MDTEFDLQEQQEEEQFTEETEDKPSKEIARYLREQKKYEKLNKKKATPKHKATYKRENNINCYVCDNCGKTFTKETGSLIYNKDGEFGYCIDCLKEKYPNYRHINLIGTIDKLDFMSNHADTQYFNRL